MAEAIGGIVERPPTKEPVGCCSVAGVCLPITKSALVGVLSVERRDGDGEGMVRKVGIWLARHCVCCCPGSFKVVMVGKKKEKVTHQTSTSDHQRLASRPLDHNNRAPNQSGMLLIILNLLRCQFMLFNHKYMTLFHCPRQTQQAKRDNTGRVTRCDKDCVDKTERRSITTQETQENMEISRRTISHTISRTSLYHILCLTDFAHNCIVLP